ncbi:Kinase, STE STE20 [Giardia muris]|uniref:non-specific serine/threonine protein kinase n=1 Tax=Giardia muris TaxID=5742 RepID=A0A4Z1SVT8_GIAMU|nr:Kinase, STE STE20 [Giardia muris]|eukprot:TNJ29884.1 Kinase, STE STE20 [Giardia muris]
MVYELIRCLGSGSFGHVHLAQDRTAGVYVAIKTVDLDQSTQELGVIQQEVTLMSRLGSPYTIRYLKSWCDESKIRIVMEPGLCSVSDILHVVGSLDERVACYLMYQMVKGVAYLHQSDIFHRDLKCANVLLTDESETQCGVTYLYGRKEGPVPSIIFGVKLCDFGVSTTISASMSKRNTFVGSPYWLAPEIIRSEPYDKSSDIWALGICLYELIYSRPPYADQTVMSAMRNIVNGPSLVDSFTSPPDRPPLSKHCRDFAACCLARDKEQRYTASQLLKHKWFRGIHRAASNEVLSGVFQKYVVASREIEYARTSGPFAIERSNEELGLINSPEETQEHGLRGAPPDGTEPRISVEDGGNYEYLSWSLSSGSSTSDEAMAPHTNRSSSISKNVASSGTKIIADSEVGPEVETGNACTNTVKHLTSPLDN